MSESEFVQEWDFLNDEEINRLQFLLEESLSVMQEKENFKVKTAEFEVAWNKFFPNALTKALADQIYLKKLIKFLRKNLLVLDLGGISRGRSSQDALISQSNRELVQKIGEDSYSKIVREIENEK